MSIKIVKKTEPAKEPNGKELLLKDTHSRLEGDIDDITRVYKSLCFLSTVFMTVSNGDWNGGNSLEGVDCEGLNQLNDQLMENLERVEKSLEVVNQNVTVLVEGDAGYQV